jgi:Flp pilus assembly protein TadG
VRQNPDLRADLQRREERGTVIVLVAVVMLFVVGAMAAISIDVVTLYTARSEAQLAADSAALAAARVLANSGATSDTSGKSMTAAWTIAQAVGLQVAMQNQVGGTSLNSGQITISSNLTSNTNPTVTAQVQVSTLPAFFSRIWGNTQLAVSASATAEAYNPSSSGSSANPGPPVAPLCVKPWLLPNMDPSGTATNGEIFDPILGTIQPSGLLGWTSGTPMQTVCTNCGTLPAPVTWDFYPGDTSTTFSPTPQSFPSCSPALTTTYEQTIGGCLQTPIACNSTANIAITDDFTRKSETARGANCLTHSETGGGDQVSVTIAPFQFLAGSDNPIPGLAGNNANVMVSDSLVTVPVFNSTTGTPPTTSVQIIGFVQLFLNPNGQPAPTFGSGRGQVNTTVINMAGCGTSATAQPILGNGASPVAVRLISPSSSSQVAGASFRKKP